MTTTSPAPHGEPQRAGSPAGGADEPSSDPARSTSHLHSVGLTGLTGRTLRDRFIIGAVLGQGGQCTVYHCKRCDDSEAAEGPADERASYAPGATRTPRHAALKVLNLNGATREMREIFFSEYRIQARIHSRRIVRTYEFFASEDLLCLTMDVFSGGSLAAVQGRPLPVGIAIGLAIQLFEGLSVLHARGVIHRDIKPGNLLLEEPLDLAAMQGVPGTPAEKALCALRIADFGIADVQDMSFGDRGYRQARGTLHFMAPELLGRDTVDARVDIYAAGVTLFYFLTGHHPLSTMAYRRKLDTVTDSLSSTKEHPAAPDAAGATPRGSRSSTEQAIESHLYLGQSRQVDVKAVAPEIPDDLVAIVSSLIDPDPARRPRTAAVAGSLLYAWFTAHADEHGVRLGSAPQLCFDPYLAASAFCGREQELAAADQFFARLYSQDLLRSAREGALPSLQERKQRVAPSILRIFGESGSGKSRLSRQICRRIRGPCHLVHIQTDRELGAYLRVMQVRDEFEAYYQQQLHEAQRAPGDRWQALNDPDSAIYVPDLEHGSDPRYASLRTKRLTEPEQDKARAELGDLLDEYRSERFAATLRLWSYERPLCFLIEDAQWLDRASMRLLGAAMRFLSGSRGDGFCCRVAFVVTHRPKEDGDQVDYVLEQLASVAHSEQPAVLLELGAFSLDDAQALLTSILGMEGTAQSEQARRFIEALARQRPLTPLSVEQSLWTLFSEGSLISRDADGHFSGVWNLDPALICEASAPASIRDAIGQRAARFDTQTLRVLGAAAVVGKSFDIEVVARALSLEGKDVLAAIDLAGRAGFVRQIEATAGDYLADRATSGVTCEFLHDRYREAIVAALPAEVKRRLHGAIAQAVKARFGENEQTWECLAEHHEGAEEYAQAYLYAERIGDQAFAKMQDEQAARNYEVMVRSCSRRGEPVPVAVHDRCAQSLESIGRFTDAQQHLRALLVHPELGQAARMDINRRLAEGAYRQQDYANALPALLSLLQSYGVTIPPRSLADHVKQLQGALLLLATPLMPALLRGEPGLDQDVAEQLLRIIYTTAECSAFVEWKVGVAAGLLVSRLAIRGGLNKFTPVCLAGMGFLTASVGLFRHSQRFDALAIEHTPPPPSAGPDRSLLRIISQRDAHLLCTKTYRGELGRSHDAALTELLARGHLAARLCGDPQQRWLWLLVAAQVSLWSGRIALFERLINSALIMAAQCNRAHLCAFGEPYRAAALADIESRDDKADAICTLTLPAIRAQGSALDTLRLHGIGLLCRARSQSADVPVSHEALAAVREWIARRLSTPSTACLGSFAAAAALSEYRKGLLRPSAELQEILKLVRPSCLRERQLTPYYLAALATVAAMKRDHRHALAQLERAARLAVDWGFLGPQLTAVLRIATWILPSTSREHAYFSTWEKNLTANLLNQESVDLKDLEQRRLPPAPLDGRPE